MPSTQTSPLVGRSSRLISFRRVVLPAPLGPTRKVRSPGSSAMLTSSSARREPYARVTPLNSRIGRNTDRITANSPVPCWFLHLRWRRPCCPLPGPPPDGGGCLLRRLVGCDGEAASGTRGRFLVGLLEHHPQP